MKPPARSCYCCYAVLLSLLAVGAGCEEDIPQGVRDQQARQAEAQ